jgi:CheY-like chemotaxis protein
MFTLELSAITASQMRTPSESSSPSQLGETRLLVVEDHRDTTRMLYLLLAGLGYTVKTAGDAASALQLVNQESFDLMICDIGLPDETGYELMKQIREHHPIKGIAVTAHGTVDDVRKSRDAGFSEHLLKPVELSQLHEAIQRVLGHQ